MARVANLTRLRVHHRGGALSEVVQQHPQKGNLLVRPWQLPVRIECQQLLDAHLGVNPNCAFLMMRRRFVSIDCQAELRKRLQAIVEVGTSTRLSDETLNVFPVHGVLPAMPNGYPE
jgi:hypothetical protein